jgi:hypothetical protein
VQGRRGNESVDAATVGAFESLSRKRDVAVIGTGQGANGGILDGWVSLVLSIWLLGGLAIFSIGLVGLYVARIFIETKNRPYTITRKVYGINKK